MEALDEPTRRQMHCGWLDEAEWTEPFFGGDVPQLGLRSKPIDLETLKVCPGWLTRQPSVVECSSAALALKKGQLSTFYPNSEAGILEGALLGEQAFNLYEAEMMKKASGK